MQRFRQYWHTAWYVIRQNRIYAVFCVLGTALTFVFITLLLQLVYTVMGNTPPFIHSDRTISLGVFTDQEGEFQIIPVEELASLEKLVKGYEKIALLTQKRGGVFIRDIVQTPVILFTNADFWSIYQFDFLAGHPYTERDVADKRLVAVVSETFAKENYPDGDAVGQTLEFEHKIYRIIGVIANYPQFYSDEITGGEVYIPFTTQDIVTYLHKYQILFPETMPIETAKRNISQAVAYFFKNKNINVDFPPGQILTEKERNLQQFGGNMMLYGAGGILLLLLIVPALNIITLNIANAYKRSEEIALRRAIGASRSSAIWLLISENFLLVVTGGVLGIALAYPVAFGMGNLMQDNGGQWLIAGIGLGVIVCVLLLCLVFTLLSGGLPAWMASRQRIAETLKGGSKW